MKRKYNYGFNEINNKKLMKGLILSLFLITVTLSIGFAAFNKQLLVQDTSAIVRVQKDVRITGLEYSSSVSSALSNDEQYNVDDIFGTAYLPNLDSEITYKVEVKNLGNVKAGIKDIYFTEESISGSSLCTPVTSTTLGQVPSGNFDAGDKYACQVAPGVMYYFYVLNTEGDNVNLIMDRNLPSDSTDVNWGESYGTSETYSTGPTTALQTLYNLTKDWTNVPNIDLNYQDEGPSYNGITTTNNVTKVLNIDNTVTLSLMNLKARLPKASEVSNYSSSSNNAYLFDNLYAMSYSTYASSEGNYINGLEFNLNTVGSSYGYWTLSSIVSPYYIPLTAVSVRYKGDVSADGISQRYGYSTGIRPVITIPKSEFYNTSSAGNLEYIIEEVETPICTPVTSSVAGNVPTGNYNTGDEYICKVNDEDEFHFYILNTSGNQVNMIMDRNICSDGTTNSSSCYVAWSSEFATSETNDLGPTTAIEYLNEATSSWTNISNLNQTYYDEQGNFGAIELNGKARLPKYSEVSNYISSTRYLYDNMNECSGDLSNTNAGTDNGYWTLSSANSTSSSAYVVSARGVVDKTTSTNSAYGVRPVITVTKSALQNSNGLSDYISICDNGRCTLGATKEFYITVKYKNGVTSSDIGEGYNNFNLHFDFGQIYDVTYTDVTCYDCPEEAMENTKFTASIGTDEPLAIMGNQFLELGTDFTYNSSLLTIPNVTGDIEIRPAKYTLVFDNNISSTNFFPTDSSVWKRQSYETAIVGTTFTTNSSTTRIRTEIPVVGGYSISTVLPSGYKYEIVELDDSNKVTAYWGDWLTSSTTRTLNSNTTKISLLLGLTSNDSLTTSDVQNIDFVINLSTIVRYDSTFGTLPITSRTNYVFDGWYTEKNGGVKVTSTTKVSSSPVETLYAHWILSDEINLLFDRNVSSLNFLPINKNAWKNESYSSVIVGNEISTHTINTRIRSEFSVLGGYDMSITLPSGYKYEIVELDDSSKVTAFWGEWLTSSTTKTLNNNTTKVSILISNSSDTSISSSDVLSTGIMVDLKKTLKKTNQLGTLPTPTRDGYTFDGWYTESTNGTKVDSTTLGSSLSTTTLYAHWSPNTYTLNYNNNGGSGCSSKNITVGEQYGSLCTPTRDGYVFLGWYTEEYKSHPLYYYSDNWSDLKNALGYDEDSLYSHYITFGQNEGRRIASYISTDTIDVVSDITVYAGWYQLNTHPSVSISNSTYLITPSEHSSKSRATCETSDTECDAMRVNNISYDNSGNLNFTLTLFMNKYALTSSTQCSKRIVCIARSGSTDCVRDITDFSISGNWLSIGSSRVIFNSYINLDGLSSGDYRIIVKNSDSSCTSYYKNHFTFTRDDTTRVPIIFTIN